MPKTKQQKQAAMEMLSSGIRESKLVVFANFQGLKVSESEALRRECREQGIQYVASKKTLVHRALSDVGIVPAAASFDGAVAAVFGATDEIAPAKVIADFAKTHDVVRIFGGIFQGAFIDAGKVSILAALPSKEQLLAKMVGSLNAPVSGFVNVLAGNLRGLVNVLNGIKEQKV